MNLNLDNSGIAEPIRFLLQSCGATPAGVSSFRLPNGEVFIATRLRNGDKQAVESQLTKLKRMLGQASNPQRAEEPRVVPPPASPTIQQRIEEGITLLEAEERRLTEETSALKKRIEALRAVAVALMDIPDAEAVLASFLTPQEPPRPEPPPQIITERLQVTRQLVFVGTQAMTGRFKVDDLVDVMMQGRKVHDTERVRIRSCVAAMLVSMVERGEVKKVEEGRGKKPAFFIKAESNAFLNEATSIVPKSVVA